MQPPFRLNPVADRPEERGEVTVAQICLWLSANESSTGRLEAALAAVPLACVFIEGKSEAVVRMLVDLAQKKNVAAVLVDQVTLAKRVGADGVHLSAGGDVLDRMVAARKTLGETAIVGATCGESRHVAMEIGEAGADVVAFGPEDEVVAIGDTTRDDDVDAEPPMTRAELVTWWSAVFEVPCLALDVARDDPDIADALGEDDFAAWRWPVGTSIVDGVDALQGLAERLNGTEVEV